ncbi:MAG: ATP-binding protein [Peptococcaceae bacterium]|nr:ATP-binding protein [Peptococcaceae bacterium]
MLLRFSFENFRSFKNKTTLKMLATTQRTLNDVLIRKGKHRILPSAVLYGANASGKSSVILAMQTFRTIVLSGSISNDKSVKQYLELYPFLHDDNTDPIIFEIEFIDGGHRFVYGFTVSVEPLKRNGKRCILEEHLDLFISKTPIKLFHRSKDNITIGRDKYPLKLLEYKDDSELAKLVNTMVNNIDEEVLFLTSGFKSTISKTVSDRIIGYISEKVHPIMNLSDELHNTDNTAVINDKFYEAIIKAADFGPQQIKWRLAEKEENKYSKRLVSSYRGVNIRSEFIESVGTIRLLHFADKLKQCFSEGSVLLIDEMDNAIHPEIIKGIIALFSNPEANKNGAQIVFTSHNPVYMDHDLLRRDQILFTEKDLDTYISTIHSLGDFGSVSVRNDQSLMRNYFKGRYGRLPYIDFETVLALGLED